MQCITVATKPDVLTWYGKVMLKKYLVNNRYTKILFCFSLQLLVQDDYCEVFVCCFLINMWLNWNPEHSWAFTKHLVAAIEDNIYV